nr:EAL domain-containing protein [Pseudomonas typographi]
MNAENARLTNVAELALARAERSFRGAAQVLGTMQATTLAPCSEAHIAHMQALTANTPFIEEVGYIAGGMLRCSSWGVVQTQVNATPADFRSADGIDVHTQVQPLVAQGSTMVALQQGDYNVLILPARLVDVITDRDVQIGLRASNGQWIATSAGASAQWLGEAHPDWLQAQVQGEGWQAVAMQPREHLRGALGRELLWLLPIGMLTAAVLVAWVVWLSRKRLSPLAELALAVRHEEFVVHYQPIMQLATGVCVGAEALVRWQRPDGTMVRPDLFIPLAEESGLVQPITDQVVRAVVRELGTLLAADRSVHIAVNLCAEDIKSGRILPVIDQALHGTDVRPEQLWLEATERGFMAPDSARQTIEAARARGHSVAIDDFGTGFSSLQYLQNLPLDALKIDKAFIDTLGAEAATSSVTGHIIDMARALNLFIVAEGIETQAQADYLRARQVDFGQGWLYAKAMPAEQFTAFYQHCKAQVGSGPAVVQVARPGHAQAGGGPLPSAPLAK